VVYRVIRWALAPNGELEARRQFANEVFSKVFDPDVIPMYVSDESSLDEINPDLDEKLEQRVLAAYGLKMTPQLWRMPVWEFLDYLKAHLIRLEEEERPH
jgi:hypothetical protein